MSRVASARQRSSSRFIARVLLGAKPAPFPGFIEPALTTPRIKIPTGARFVHELKLDGYRVQAHLLDGRVRLYTRSGLGPVLLRILVVPVCYGPSIAVGSSNYIGIGQSSNWLRTDRGTSLNVGVSTRGRSRCHGSGAAVARGTCNRCDQKTRRPGLAAGAARGHARLAGDLVQRPASSAAPV